MFFAKLLGPKLPRTDSIIALDLIKADAACLLLILTHTQPT